MATLLKLVHTDMSDLSLISAEGAGARAQKWTPTVAPITYRYIPEYVTEEIDVRIDRDTDDNLATVHQNLETFAGLAERFWCDRTVYKPVWLHCKMDSETYTRRALVQSIEYSLRSNPIQASGLAVVHDTLIRLKIRRHPYWEDITYNQVAGSGSVAGASIIYDVSNVTAGGFGHIAGTVPARPIVLWRSNDLIDKIWMGIRSTKHGDPANFENIWECESGALGADTSVQTPDATASGNSRIETTFAGTPGWANRCSMVLDIICSNEHDQPGRFQELLRMKVDAGTTVEVYLKAGFDNSIASSYFVVGPTVEIDDTNWNFYEMGDLVVPPLNCQAGDFTSFLSPDDFVDDTEIQIWARRTGGYGSLHVDCMCPVPVDEGYCFISDIEPVSSALWQYFWLSERDEGIFSSSWTTMNHMPRISDHNFRFPPGEVRLVVVYAEITQSVITNAIEVDSEHYPRWVSLRGGDGI